MAAEINGGAGGHWTVVEPLIDSDPAGCYLFQGTPSWGTPHREIVERAASAASGPVHHDFGHAVLNLFSIAETRGTRAAEVNKYAQQVIHSLNVHGKEKALPSRADVIKAVKKRDYRNQSSIHTHPEADRLLKLANEAIETYNLRLGRK